MDRKGNRNFNSSRVRVCLLLLFIGSLLGCGQRSAPDEQLVRQPIEAGKLKFGYNGSSGLVGLKEKGEFAAKLEAQSIVLEWIPFANDAALFRAIEEGRVDIGSVGDAVPAFLYREDAPLVYLAAEPSNPTAYAIIVPLDSNIYSAADLKGKRIAYSAYSNEHLLLLQVLEAAGLSEKDVKKRELLPSDSVRSFEGREADAWVIGEPEFSRMESYGIRVVADGSSFLGNREIYVTTPESIEGREWLMELVLDQISYYDDWLINQVHDAAELLANYTDIAHNSWLGSFDRKAYGTAPMLDSIVKEEQKVVDTIFKFGGRKDSFQVNRFVR